MSAVDQNTNPTHSMTKDGKLAIFVTQTFDDRDLLLLINVVCYWFISAAEEIKIPVPWGHLSGQ